MNTGAASGTIHGGGYTATLLSAGGGLGSLSYDGDAVVRGPHPGAVVPSGRGQVLVPWPNRLRDGRYTFAGEQQQLALSEPARHNASHGLVRWCTWAATEVSADAVTMAYRLAAQRGYPWTLDLSADYRLTSGGLTVTLAATNASDRPAPFAAGQHPYLDVGAPLDECTLTMPAGTHQRVDERLLPAGTGPVTGTHDLRAGRSLRGVSLDDSFTDLSRDDQGLAVVRLSGPDRAVELWLDEAWPWVQAFTGDELGDEARLSLAVEPMSAPADAFNSGIDLVVLQPGRTWTGTFGIRVAAGRGGQSLRSV